MMRESSLYCVAMLVSLFFSYWIAAHELIINPDAICYLQSANMFSHSSLSAVMHYCGQAVWPFYSLLIYALAHLMHTSYIATAYGLDGLFSLISVLTFILIAKRLGGDVTVLWFAAFTILFAHEFNSARDYIIRDHGFWAFYLLSILFLLMYVSQGKIWQALLFNLSLIMATLFRIEGAIFLLLLPHVSWSITAVSWRQRLKSFFVLNLSLLCGIIFLLPWLAFHPVTLLHFGRLPEIINQLQHAVSIISDRYHHAVLILKDQILTEDAKADASQIVFVMMLGWYIVSIINNLTVLYLILIFYILRASLRTWSSNHLIVLAAYIVINLGITFIFLNERFFLSKRYLMALSLVLMLWVPFALSSLFSKQKKLCYVLGLWMLLTTGWHFHITDVSKLYLLSGANWVATHVPQNARLYSNNLQLMYYSNHFGDNIFAAYREPLNGHYDYMMLRLAASDPDPILRKMTLMQSFKNKHGDRVMIYQFNPLMAEKNQ